MIEAVGQGGFGTVWRVWDRDDHEQVAIKVLHGQFAHDRSRIDRFFSGSKQMGRLRHPGVARVRRERVEHDGFHYLVMDWYPTDLHRAVLSGTSAEDALRALVSVARALEYAHGRGLVHRDVKPHNILLRGGESVLADFDLVHAVDTTHGTRTNQPMGSWCYAAPELLKDASGSDARADVYGLGMTALFCVLGQDLDLWEVMRDLPGMLAHAPLSAELRDVIAAAVRQKREERTASAEAFAAGVEAAIRGGVADPHVPSAARAAAADSHDRPLPTPPPSTAHGNDRGGWTGGENTAARESTGTAAGGGAGEPPLGALGRAVSQLEEAATSLESILSARPASRPHGEGDSTGGAGWTARPLEVRPPAPPGSGEEAGSDLAVRPAAAAPSSGRMARTLAALFGAFSVVGFVGWTVRDRLIKPGQYFEPMTPTVTVENPATEIARAAGSGAPRAAAPPAYDALPGTPIHFIGLPGGTFTMGSPTDEPGRDDDEVQHDVTVSPFWIGETEVTQAQYLALVGSNPSDKGYNGVSLLGDDLPVQNISWFDSVKLANALSKHEGLRPAYAITGTLVTWLTRGNGYRLPTEAEWEYAARGGSAAARPGATTDAEACRIANVYGPLAKEKLGWVWPSFGCEDGFTGASPVRHHAPNASGLFDTLGNVWEWTWDWYAPYAASPASNPRGASVGHRRVVRGGSWAAYPAGVRVAARYSWDPGSRVNFVGVRLARSVPAD